MQAFLVRLVAFTFAALMCASPLLAQGGEDDYDFSEIPVEEEDIPYIGVGGGYQLMVTLYDDAALNTAASEIGMGQFSGPMIMHGGGGWTAIGIIPNVRLGVFGGAGSKELTSEIENGTDKYKRSLRFSSGYTVAHVDYAIPVISKLTIAPGFMLGGGSTTLEYSQTKVGATFASLFDSTKIVAGGGDLSRQSSVSRSYPIFIPVLNIEYAMTQFILVRAGVGYAIAPGDSWEDRHGNDVASVPDITN
ncbi:MAG: hypothetical protein H7X80_05470, partial [bacterium]|nr:hypothetical protein [Candidatus Kapabacteria bacterium]